MKIAVTGASGFIGKHVLSELAGHSVEGVAVVRKFSSVKTVPENIRLVQLDLDNPPKNALDVMGQPDVLIHLAWGGLPNYRSSHHCERELPNQFRFLTGIIQTGLSNLIVAGTCLEYGMQSGSLSEDRPAYPDNSYASAKDTLRRRLLDFRDKMPFAFTWARLFYIYGDGQAESSLLSQLKRSVEQGQPSFNMSGGEQLRDYLPVADVAKNLVKLALNKADMGILNICSGKPVSVRKLVEGWIEQNGWKIKLNLGYYPYPDYEPLEFWGDSAKLNHFLSTMG